MMNVNMNTAAGFLSILSALCIAGSMVGLMLSFGYPKIIRENPIMILKRMQSKIKVVPLLFYLFGIGGLLIVQTSIALHTIEQSNGEGIWSQFAYINGIIYGALLFVGILRYTKTFPLLSQQMQDKQITEKEAGELYAVLNSYIGDTMTEHVAFVFLSIMMICNSVSLLSIAYIANWISILGVIIGTGLFIGNLEFLGFQKLFIINRIFSSLSVVWLLLLGISFIL